MGTAGDVNGDGFADLVAGAYWNDAAGTDAGAAYVYDCDRYFVTYPNGGETFGGDGSMQVEWLGAEPADLWLSVDDGATYELLARGMGGAESNAAEVTVPNVNTRPGAGEGDAVRAVDQRQRLERRGVQHRGVDRRGPGERRTALPRAVAEPLARRWCASASSWRARRVVTVAVLDVAGREVARPIAGERFEAGKVSASGGRRTWRRASTPCARRWAS